MFSKHNHHKERSNYSAVPHFSDSDDDDSSDDGMEDDFISREIRQQQVRTTRRRGSWVADAGRLVVVVSTRVYPSIV